ncbi:hypothetical protein ACIU1J_01970 [Azospirillum doebereinerae]|uniref:hypothetical protein n=1 Tax=Azospirillum doebereinerae TaxID=92933 RepID=UPI001EE5ABBD|nr:hypothetical protein [Azospirillum doebereinerae]MCG5240099.1 hypothetical protein [Azospirillum doebereinerae]
MPLNLTNLHAALQSKVDALGPSADEKTLLLLSKAIEAAIGNVSVSEVLAQATAGVDAITAAAASEVAAIGQAGVDQVALVNSVGGLTLAQQHALAASFL